MGIGTTAGLVVTAVLVKLIGDEAKAWLPKIVERLVRRAIKKLPDVEQERFDEEWRADLDETPGDLGKLLIALGFQFAAWRMHVEMHTPVERLREIAVKVKRTLFETVWGRRSTPIMAFGLFALLVGVPFLMEHLLSRHTQLFWQDALSYAGFGIVVLLLVSFLIVLAIFLPQTYQISEHLTLAEREMNRLLRGGKVVEARATALLLHELYAGNVATAQLKIHNEIENGGKPFIAPGLRNLLGLDKFNDAREVLGSGVARFPLVMAVKLNRYPRNIIMVRADKTVAHNRAVIEQLTRQLRPAAM
jgi:hypothetical protein